MNDKINVAIVDDHPIYRKGLIMLMERLGYTVALACGSGKELIERLDVNSLPDVILMDTYMPEMDGYETTLWLKNNYPLAKVLAMFLYEEDAAERMLANGARGFIFKDTDSSEWKKAVKAVAAKGHYYPEPDARRFGF